MTQIAVFDAAANQYDSIVNASLKSTGATASYFAHQKAEYLRQAIWRLGQEPIAILDVGCGIGLLTAELSKVFLWPISIVGYDPSKTSIGIARARYPKIPFYDSPSHLQGAKFDLVVVANVLHHIDTQDRDEFLSRVRRWIAPNGYLVIFEHNPWNPVTRKIVKDCPLDTGVTLIPPPICTQLLAAAGLNPVTQEFIAFFPAWLSWLRCSEPYLWWFPLGAQYVIVAQRIR